jgi:hypothetical protein
LEDTPTGGATVLRLGVRPALVRGRERREDNEIPGGSCPAAGLMATLVPAKDQIKHPARAFQPQHAGERRRLSRFYQNTARAGSTAKPPFCLQGIARRE